MSSRLSCGPLFGAFGYGLGIHGLSAENAGVLFTEQNKLVKSIRWGALRLWRHRGDGVGYSYIEYHR